uniref:Uncharacterized protein n=1 Tax=viral metagenome TaxID=1070528 RepID=A0A6H2A374_9ZZZZ
MKTILLAIIIILLTGGYAYADSDKLEWFESEEQLRQWVDENHLTLMMTVNSEGMKASTTYDCDDYAEDLVKLAESQGYRLMECPVRNGYVWNRKVINIYGMHVGCWTKVNNVYYYIEPNPLMSKVIKIIEAD